MNERLLSHNLAIISEECSSVSYFLLNRRVTNESNLTITTTPIHPKLLSIINPAVRGIPLPCLSRLFSSKYKKTKLRVFNTSN